MNNKQKINFFWKIVMLIEKKHCKNKRLKIKKIIFFKRRRKTCYSDKRDGMAYYNWKRQEIGIIANKKIPLIRQIESMVHEIAHAYDWELNSKRLKGKRGKKLDKIHHNKTWKRTFDKFTKTFFKNLEIKPKQKGDTLMLIWSIK
jgi:hypothetical protein